MLLSPRGGGKLVTKKKWAGIQITEHNVDEYLFDLSNGKSRYITQGVSFNKEDAVQMNLLRLALIRHGSFSGFSKFLLSEVFKEANVDWETHPLNRCEHKVKDETIHYKSPALNKGFREEIAIMIMKYDKQI